jgi:hypothetical protein
MVAVTSGDLIPINDDNGSGQYVLGRNSARDIRVGLIGPQYLPGADGYTPRQGALLRQSNSADLKVDPQASPNQTVIVRKGTGIVPRTGQGAYIFNNEADQNVNMPTASGVNSRYDIVCASAYDKGAFGADASHGPEFVVVSGVVSGSPAVPSTPAGMIKLADVLRATNDNVIGAGDIADKRNSTGINNSFRLLPGGDSSADPGLVTGESRLAGLRGPEWWTGTRWTRIGLDVAATIAAIPAELAVENSFIYHAGLKRVIRYTSGAWDLPYDVTPGGDVEIAADFPVATPTLVTNMTVANKALVGMTHSAGVFTVQVTGWWNLTFTCRFSAATGDKYAFIVGSGTTNVWGKDSTNAEANTQATCSKYLTAGAQFRCYAYSSTGGNVTHESGGDDVTGLQAAWMGA